ncbi:MAG: cupin-like domain-containing protein [Verrucomicrobiales bacterium]|nr:cupin-like domain-containing protein [Verrucomicrobiales bacterium]
MEATVDRRRNLSVEEFRAEYLFKHRPVVIEGAMDHWRAMKEWSPDYFRRRFPDVEVSITDRNGKSAKYRMDDLMDRVERSDEGHPAPYLRNEVIERTFPSLLEDFSPLPPYLRPNWLSEQYLLKPLQKEFNRGALMELFIGGKGAGFPKLHYDYLGTHAYLMQVYGEKRVIFFSPDQTPYVYPNPSGSTYSLIDDPSKVDLEKFPLYAKATPRETTLRPGDLLFIPTMWWHTTKMTSSSISLSVNQLNVSNWREMTAYVCRKRSAVSGAVIRAYLHFAGGARRRRDGL